MKPYLAAIKKELDHPLTLISLLLLALFPFFYFLLSFYWDMKELSESENRIELIHKRSFQIERQKKIEEAYLSEMKQADHFYIDKHIETLVFLDPEMKRLQAQSLQEDQNEPLLQRLDFLEHSNRLLFAEENLRHAGGMQEVEERQQHPVEMNEEDLKKLLTAIEGISIPPYERSSHRPQLIIQNFELSKKSVSPQEKVFIVNMRLIKRELQ